MLEALALVLKGGHGGVQLSSHKWQGAVVKHCFLGSELVDWMMANLKKSWGITSRLKAVALGRCLLECDFIQKVGGQNRFEDACKFYHFMVRAQFYPRSPE